MLFIIKTVEHYVTRMRYSTKIQMWHCYQIAHQRHFVFILTFERLNGDSRGVFRLSVKVRSHNPTEYDNICAFLLNTICSKAETGADRQYDDDNVTFEFLCNISNKNYTVKSQFTFDLIKMDWLYLIDCPPHYETNSCMGLAWILITTITSKIVIKYLQKWQSYELLQ